MLIFCIFHFHNASLFSYKCLEFEEVQRFSLASETQVLFNKMHFSLRIGNLCTQTSSFNSNHNIHFFSSSPECEHHIRLLNVDVYAA